MKARSLMTLAGVIALGVALGSMARLLLNYYGSADMTMTVFLAKLPGCW
ncbi:MAG: hypothetical protein KDJ22_07925 [Candidatus Competibacteraceae bacterium]|nr:hypothetical protein [Candidatus Competibacteraceae bacterium]MCP5127421.1 hypothetical protein [Gammaproteobacteria bacterium]HRX70300.1 hypothetical protein [Candidatus Competibacteraceae bacterium]